MGRREKVSFSSPIRCPERLDDYHYDNDKNNESRCNNVPVTELRSLCASSH